MLLMFHHSVTSQILSAGFAEFNKEMEPAVVHIVQNLVHGAIGPKAGLNDHIECPLGSRNDWSGDASLIRPSRANSLARSAASSFW